MDKEATYQDIRGGIVIKLLADDEDMAILEATDFWDRWKVELGKNPEHFGDCTNEPNICNRCLIEDYYRRADEILSLQVGNLKVGVYEVESELPKWPSGAPVNEPVTVSEMVFNAEWRGYIKAQTDMEKANYQKIVEE